MKIERLNKIVIRSNSGEKLIVSDENSKNNFWMPSAWRNLKELKEFKEAIEKMICLVEK